MSYIRDMVDLSFLSYISAPVYLADFGAKSKSDRNLFQKLITDNRFHVGPLSREIGYVSCGSIFVVRKKRRILIGWSRIIGRWLFFRCSRFWDRRYL